MIVSRGGECGNAWIMVDAEGHLGVIKELVVNAKENCTEGSYRYVGSRCGDGAAGGGIGATGNNIGIDA